MLRLTIIFGILLTFLVQCGEDEEAKPAEELFYHGKCLVTESDALLTLVYCVNYQKMSREKLLEARDTCQEVSGGSG